MHPAGESEYLLFDVTTSLGWDTGRAITDVVLILLAGPAASPHSDVPPAERTSGRPSPSSRLPPTTVSTTTVGDESVPVPAGARSRPVGCAGDRVHR
jgi:hypothetical protein